MGCSRNCFDVRRVGQAAFPAWYTHVNVFDTHANAPHTHLGASNTDVCVSHARMGVSTTDSGVSNTRNCVEVRCVGQALLKSPPFQAAFEMLDHAVKILTALAVNSP